MTDGIEHSALDFQNERIAYEIQGLTLRDYFAGQALACLCSAGVGGRFVTNASYETMAQDAYKIADAMLATRRASS